MLKSLPSIDQVLLYPGIPELCDKYSHELVASCARDAVEELREELREGAELPLGGDGKLEPGLVTDRVGRAMEKLLTPSLKRVVNATGIVIHTNLGRSPLSANLIEAMADVIGAYGNIEFDLEAGARGSRHAHLTRLIRAVTKAEAGFVVNNNAAAVLVALNSLAKGREVVISRGELVEIGGSFRIPDIITSSGAIIREVGTTNKTRLVDYERAIGPDTALILKVHPSNYKIVGFTEEAGLKELSELGRDRGIPVMMDLGSGLLVDLSGHGIEAEKPVSWYVGTGADIITFSGDKLLGGPQAGFVVGGRDLVEHIKNNPMVRALRVGKLTIAALESMLISYLSPQTLIEKVPTLQLLTRSADTIKATAKKIAKGISKRIPEAKVEVEPDQAFAGGGSLPAEALPTSVVTIELPGMEAEDLARALRSAAVPVVGRLRAGVYCLDCRTLLGSDPPHIFSAIEKIKASR